MSQFLRFFLALLTLSFCTEVFATAKTPVPLDFSGVISTETVAITSTGNYRTGLAGLEGENNTDDISPEETKLSKKEKEQTIDDINTFLIESYKIKIDKILANLNMSLERVTNNDPVAQAKLLEKIRGDIDIKIQVINSRSISENRKKILSSIFSYIQENLDTKISKLVQQK
ncbi:MAG: hypothetical protein PHH70_03400 [Candidatus Gracilibacteria bacterium]|nr:hypothetical protein [Candidatus Gracilibacteria bacterium]